MLSFCLFQLLLTHELHKYNHLHVFLYFSSRHTCFPDNAYWSLPFRLLQTVTSPNFRQLQSKDEFDLLVVRLQSSHQLNLSPLVLYTLTSCTARSVNVSFALQ